MANENKSLLNIVLNLLFSFLKKDEAKKTVAAPVEVIEPEPIEPIAVQPAGIDWKNPKAKITPSFSVGEALTLPSWGVMHEPSEDEKLAIENVAKKVTGITERLEIQLGKQLSISVHAWMRPGIASVKGSEWDGKDYNRFIYESQVWSKLTAEEKSLKKVPNSPHKTGNAIDFHYVGYEGKEKCREIRTLLVPHLEEFGLRCEDMGGGWVHLDCMPVKNSRFFKP